MGPDEIIGPYLVGRWAFLHAYYPVDRSGITAEHVYQARKATCEEDYIYVLQSVTPGQAQRRAKAIENRPDWHEVREAFLLDALRWKFHQRPLLDEILATGEATIIDDEKGEVPTGPFLMQVREELREEVRSHRTA